jgi:hypothetical protein
MFLGIRRSRRRAPAEGTSAIPSDAASSPGVPRELVDDAHEGAAPAGAGGIEGLPEQPVPLPPVGAASSTPAVAADRRAGRVLHGVVLPAGRPRSLLAAALPIPRVPRRAIFAVGICAGLAAPSIVKQVAGRALTATFGPGRGPSPAGGGWESVTMEIIRVTYAGPRRGQAAEAVGKLLEQLRR